MQIFISVSISLEIPPKATGEDQEWGGKSRVPFNLTFLFINYTSIKLRKNKLYIRTEKKNSILEIISLRWLSDVQVGI